MRADSSLEQLKKDGHDLHQQFKALAAASGIESAASAATEAAFARMDGARFAVAVVGKMRSGKSTLMNALIGDGELVAPIDAITCTNALTTVERGERPMARIHIDARATRAAGGPLSTEIDEPALERTTRFIKALFGRSRRSTSKTAEAGGLETRDVPRNTLAEWVTHQGNPNNHKGVVLAQVYSTSLLLQEGVVLVDSPGIGALGAHDPALAHVVAGEADSTILVYSRSAVLGREEMVFLVDALAQRRQRDAQHRASRRTVVVVQNDWARSEFDEPEQYEVDCQRVANATRESIATEWKRRQDSDPQFPHGPPPGTTIYRVNAQTAWHGIRTGRDDLIQRSRLPELKAALTDYLVSGPAKQHLSDVADEINLATARLQDSLEARDAALSAEAEAVQARLLDFRTCREQLTDEDQALSKASITKRLADSAEEEGGRIAIELRESYRKGIKKLRAAADNDAGAAAKQSDEILETELRNGLLHLDATRDKVTATCAKLMTELQEVEHQAVALVGGARPTERSELSQVKTGYTDIEVDVTLDGEFFRFFRRIIPLFDKGALKRDLITSAENAEEQLMKELGQKASESVAQACRLRTKETLDRREALASHLSELERQLTADNRLKAGERRARREQLQAQLKNVRDLREQSEQFLRVVGTL